MIFFRCLIGVAKLMTIILRLEYHIEFHHHLIRELNKVIISLTVDHPSAQMTGSGEASNGLLVINFCRSILQFLQFSYN